jgi:hypothetical protein
MKNLEYFYFVITFGLVMNITMNNTKKIKMPLSPGEAV